MSDQANSDKHSTPDEKATASVIDPVCGMTVTLGKGKPNVLIEGTEYHFCSQGCCDKFSLDPEFYLTGSHKKKAKAAPKNTTYTCPMHPEIIEDHLIDCPLCGMALEPMGIPDDKPNPELIDFTRRFWISAFLTLPLIFIAMAPMLGVPVREILTEPIASWAELMLATPVVLWAGWPFFKRGWGSIQNRSPNMWTLIAIGVGTAFIYSVVVVAAPGIFPANFQMENGAIPIYFESAAVIIVLVFLGQILELKARERTGEAIKSLMQLAPSTARRINANGSERDVPIENILQGDKVRIRPGERIPVDGVVLEGASAIDESMLSGEPIPVDKQTNDPVTGGTLNKSGTLVIEAQKVGSDTLLSQIVEMVATAQRTRAPIQGLADKVAGYFVPAVVLSAITAFIVWALIGPDPKMVFALLSAVSVLIIACPCALGLATPMSIMTATGRGAHAGVLIQDAEALEQFSQATVIIMDKTGTLTSGKPSVNTINSVGSASRSEILAIAAGLENGSEHPLAEAILKIAKDENVPFAKVEDFENIVGLGVQATHEKKHVLIGNSAFMTKNDVDLNVVAEFSKTAEAKGETILYLAQDTKLLASISISDTIKPQSKSVIAKLQAKNIQIVMATGDNEGAARHVANELGIDEVNANVMPQDKKRLVEDWQSRGHIVAMAGDGVNDAPALAQANIGIAMGTGSDVSLQSAGITLLKGDISAIMRAYKLSALTIQNIKQNLAFAFGYNLICVPIAAGVLYPFTETLLSPMIAAAAMSLSSVSVIFNALRLRRVSLDDGST
ncbi:MAG: heavy metal translocating P-type ATPase [Pseudomonas marincola]